jgi:hypothetical protein
MPKDVIAALPDFGAAKAPETSAATGTASPVVTRKLKRWSQPVISTTSNPTIVSPTPSSSASSRSLLKHVTLPKDDVVVAVTANGTGDANGGGGSMKDRLAMYVKATSSRNIVPATAEESADDAK